MDTSCSDYQRQIEVLKNMTISLGKDVIGISNLIKSAVTTMKKDIATMKENMTGVMETLETVKGDVETVKKDVKAMKEDIETVKTDVEDVKEDIEKVKDDVDDIEDDIEDVRKDIEFVKDDIKSDVDTVKNELVNVRETTEQNMETIKSNLTGLYIKLEQAQMCNDTELPPSEPSDPGYTCGGTSGWKQVAYLNMTDTSHHCPTGWNETSYSRRTCGRASTGRATCADSVIFPVGGMEFTRVCGRVVGYQFGSLSAFYGSLHNIESHYVNGLSLTHGSAGSREHIWTFAVGLAEGGTFGLPGHKCPCDGGTAPVPEFVGDDYFCESGINGPWPFSPTFYPNDPLWDGMDCLPTSSCCTLNDPPYFIKDIGTSTTDDIEARICSKATEIRFSNVAIELVELYVQ